MMSGRIESDMDITVVIPTYNYANFIEESMESVLSQMLEGDELLIIDDGSEDNTEEVVSEFIAKSGAKNICYQKKPNGGAASARNFGIRRASCQYLILLDADDRMLPGALQLFRNTVIANKDVDLVLAAYDSKQSSGKVVSKPATPLANSREENFKLYINKKIRISHGSFLVKKDLLMKSLYPENMRCLEDQSVFAHLLALAKPISIDVSVVERYHHDNSLRNNIPALIDAGEKVVNAIFDEDVIPQSYMKYKKAYSVSRYLSVFRRLYDQGMHEESLVYFWKALKIDALPVMRVKYLKRAVKAIVKKK